MIEDYLTGPEVSVLAFSDGYTVIPLPAAQDHKRIGDGDTGPNTGGMGAYAPAPIATPEIMRRIVKETLQPTIDGMRREGSLAIKLPHYFFILDIFLCRLSLCWAPFHWFHHHRRRSKSPRIQRPLRRSRN